MFDIAKLTQLRDLSAIPSNSGEQFINVSVNITWGGTSGEIRFGFGWKLEMGVLEFHTLDEAIQMVTDLRRRAKL